MRCIPLFSTAFMVLKKRILNCSPFMRPIASPNLNENYFFQMFPMEEGLEFSQNVLDFIDSKISFIFSVKYENNWNSHLSPSDRIPISDKSFGFDNENRLISWRSFVPTWNHCSIMDWINYWPSQKDLRIGSPFSSLLNLDQHFYQGNYRTKLNPWTHKITSVKYWRRWLS